MDEQRLKRIAELQWIINDPMSDEEVTKAAEETQMKLDAMRLEDLLKERAKLEEVVDQLDRLTREDLDSYLADLPPEEVIAFIESLMDTFALAVRWERIHRRREGNG